MLNNTRPLTRTVIHLVLVVLAMLWIFPIAWTLLSGLKTNADIFTAPWELPAQLQWSNYRAAWIQGDLGTAFRNSGVVTSATVLCTMVIAIPAAYALAWFNLKRQTVLFAILLVPLAIPPEVILIPLFLMFRSLGLLNSLQGLVVGNTGLNVSVAALLLAQSFRGIPKELVESARVDGASRARILRTIILPLSAGTLVAVGLFVAVFTWNEYFVSLVIINRPQYFTIQLAMNNFSTFFATDQGLLFAALGLATLPPLLVFVLLQRKFTSGLTEGAVRG